MDQGSRAQGGRGGSLIDLLGPRYLGVEVGAGCAGFWPVVSGMLTFAGE